MIQISLLFCVCMSLAVYESIILTLGVRVPWALDFNPRVDDGGSSPRPDIEGQLAYQDSIAAFHTKLRQFYYPYFFEEHAFDHSDFAMIPRYEPRSSGGTLATEALAALALLSVLVLALGSRRLLNAGREQGGR